MIALDASIAVKLALNEPGAERVRERWASWIAAGEQLIAPSLFEAETRSVIRRNVHRHQIAEADADEALQALADLLVDAYDPPGLYDIAWDLAKRFNRPNIYDCCYLALAAMADCELWTADARFAHTVQGALSWVRLVEA